MEEKEYALNEAKRAVEEATANTGDASERIEKAEQEKKDAETALIQAEKEISDAEAALEKANVELTAARTDVENAQAKVNEAQKAYDEAVKKEAEAEAQIAKGSLGFFEYIGDTEAVEEFENEAYADIIDKTEIGAEGDATSLENMKASLELLKEYNDIRVNVQKVNPVTGEPLEADTVNSRAMAVAQIQANGAHEKVGHTHTSPFAENLAYGYEPPYDSPYDGWYYEEKEIWDQMVEDAGGDPSAINLGDPSIGHYINVTLPQPSTGIAICSKDGGAYSTTIAQEFGYADGDKLYTVEEYIALFNKYYGSLMNAPIYKSSFILQRGSWRLSPAIVIS